MFENNDNKTFNKSRGPNLHESMEWSFHAKVIMRFSTKQILENAEITNLCKIIGLNFKETYESKDSLKQLRYGKIMIMADQNPDGSHFKGLIINFVHHNWPNLLTHGFVEVFITPIV